MRMEVRTFNAGGPRPQPRDKCLGSQQRVLPGPTLTNHYHCRVHAIVEICLVLRDHSGFGAVDGRAFLDQPELVRHPSKLWHSPPSYPSTDTLFFQPESTLSVQPLVLVILLCIILLLLLVSCEWLNAKSLTCGQKICCASLKTFRHVIV